MIIVVIFFPRILTNANELYSRFRVLTRLDVFGFLFSDLPPGTDILIPPTPVTVRFHNNSEPFATKKKKMPMSKRRL